MKKINFIFALGALCAASCSQDESVDYSAATSGNTIDFMSSTSRATTLVLDDLKGAADGFVVYATDSDDETAGWYSTIDGTVNYAFADNIWGWKSSTKPIWPESGYPLNFYAYYTVASAPEFVATADAATPAASFTYNAPAALQHDILVAKATTDVRPVGDKLPLTFTHALSKVSFDVEVGSGFTVYTQSIGFNNIGSSRQYQLTGSGWAGDAATPIDYSFIATKNPAIASTTAIVGDNGDLMLLPQVSDSWDTESDASVGGSHIGMIYRAVDSSMKDVVGYTDASTHPNYDSSNPDHTKYNGRPLFIKVGYPLGGDTQKLTLEEGNSYNYAIKLCDAGTSNGYVADKFLYDDEGKPTTLPVVEKEIGDPVFDGYIDFTVDVKPWDETEVETM